MINQENESSQGFTLWEAIIAMAVLSILTAIAAPSWLHFLNLQYLHTGQNTIYRALQQAKSNAKRDKSTWQANFRQENQVIQWSVHPEDTPFDELLWQSLDPHLNLDEERTTFKEYENPDNASPKFYGVQFNHHGNVNGQLGKLIIQTADFPQMQRCVVVSTLIGAMRTASGKDCK